MHSAVLCSAALLPVCACAAAHGAAFTRGCYATSTIPFPVQSHTNHPPGESGSEQDWIGVSLRGRQGFEEGLCLPQGRVGVYEGVIAEMPC